MTKQLNLLENSNVIPTALHLEMQRSYLEYAMSVIVGRALPDVRDGLKPVHRRILYAMHELGLTPDRPYRKCARVVGDVLGKYHPHGDQAVYEAMVRLVQDFSTRYPLLDGHGNFGSVDNDPPAAMRYTETRLSPVGAQALLSEIGEATVDFIDNFDSSQQEPVVLPAQLPVLLLNGCSGIAVGMATNIPPHNLAEIVDGLIALIDRPNLPDEKLWELIPGPDFPTGGEIVAAEGIRDAYTTGRGSIPIRGITKLETIQVGRKKRGQRRAIVVSELPYQVHKAAWIEKVAALVNQGRIEGISDIRDESDREGMRVVVELKRDAQPSAVLQQLYKQTPLQTNFGAILLTLVDGQPRQLTLRQLLESFISFREQTLTRQYTYEQSQKERRLHLVDGLLASLNQLDAMIDILRNAPDGTTAKLSLQNQLNLSEIQADAILAMPMRRLTGLEREKLETEGEELSQRLEQLHQLLNDRRELLKALKKDLRSLKRKYGDPRRTIINSIASTEKKLEQPTAAQPRSKKSAQPQKTPDTLPNAPTEPEQTLLEFTSHGYVQRQSATTQP
ncbi:DNA topoisomerase (ATP-hydrolyzing), partial [Moorena sp. SIO2C4]